MNEWTGCYTDGWQGEIVPEAFSHPAKVSTSRKSFFRRLAEAKGSPAIDFEDVLCLVKTAA